MVPAVPTVSGASFDCWQPHTHKMLRLSCALVVVASVGAAPPIPGSTKATWLMDILRRVASSNAGSRSPRAWAAPATARRRRSRPSGRDAWTLTRPTSRRSRVSAARAHAVVRRDAPIARRAQRLGPGAAPRAPLSARAERDVKGSPASGHGPALRRARPPVRVAAELRPDRVVPHVPSVPGPSPGGRRRLRHAAQRRRRNRRRFWPGARGARAPARAARARSAEVRVLSPRQKRRGSHHTARGGGAHPWHRLRRDAHHAADGPVAGLQGAPVSRLLSLHVQRDALRGPRDPR
ncbi:unnamed protein product [Pelagomonas calceolata]|uniref:Uncharacterized protein n=2 Tax=Pelagomonas calceolata TaxID=35677 RepID=A0A8J2SJ04_9STRA|nr:unnamed protein product [Pelagomonas calceolata]